MSAEPNPETDVVFTQYLRPHGAAQKVWTTRSPEIAALAYWLADKGVKFEAEVLQTSEVSLTAEFGEITLASKLVQNGKDIAPAVDALVREANERMLLR